MPPQYALLLVFGTLLVALRLGYRRPLSLDVFSVRYALSMMVCFAVLALLRSGVARWQHHRRQRRSADTLATAAAAPPGALHMVRDWLPFVACLWVYENLHDLTLWIRPDTVDDTLAAIDASIFGVQPTVWLERLAHPLLTDYLALAYMTYFVFPPLLAGWLYLRGELSAFAELQLGLLCAFYAGFIGYILVPAVGPQLVLHSYAAPLEGRYFFWGAKGMVLTLQSFPRDCFPSLHTAISTVTLFFFFRHRRTVPALPWIATPVLLLTVSLWFSTVYLRYHWVVDVFAGLALAACACWAGIWLQRRWSRTLSVDHAEAERR